MALLEPLAGILCPLPPPAPQPLPQLLQNLAGDTGGLSAPLMAAQQFVESLLTYNAHPNHHPGSGFAHGGTNLLKGVLTAQSQPHGLKPLHLPAAAAALKPPLDLGGKFRNLQSKSFAHPSLFHK